MDDNFLMIPNKLLTEGNYGNGHHAKEVYNTEGVAPTITTGNHGLGHTILVKNATEKGYLEAEEGDGIDIGSRMASHRGTVQKGTIQSILTTGGKKGVWWLMPTKIKENKDIQVIDFRYDEGFRGRIESDIAPTLTTKSSGFSGMPMIAERSGGGF